MGLETRKFCCCSCSFCIWLNLNNRGKWNATYIEQQIEQRNWGCGNSILPCPIKTRKFQCTSPPFSHTIFPTFWRLLGCQCTRLWVNRFVRAPCCPKTILCAANDSRTQKNLTLSLVQKGEGAHMKHNSTLHWCASTSNACFDIKRCVSFKNQKNKDMKK